MLTERSLGAPPAAVRGLVPTLVGASLVTTAVSTLGAPLVPMLAAEHAVSLPAAQWTLTANLIVASVAVPVLGRLGDRPDRRRWLVAALATVLVGCVVSALASGFAAMLAGRALQGAGYGVLPICLAAVRAYARPPEIGGGIAALSVAGATGVGIGYAIAGGIAELLGLRVAFWCGAAVAALAIAAVLRVVPAPAGPAGERRGTDVPGALLLAAGVAALLLGVDRGQRDGWASAAVPGLVVAAAALLALWLRHELRAAAPLVDLRLLRHRSVAVANVSAFLLGLTMYMGFSVITRVAQAPQPAGLGASALVAGVLIAPLALGAQVSNRVARLAARRFGMAAVLPFGAALAALPNLLLAASHDGAPQLAVAALLFGAGVGCTFAAMPALIVEGVPADQTGSATSFNQLLRIVGGAAGSALSAVVLLAYTARGEAVPEAAGYTAAFLASAGGCLAVCAALAIARPRRPGAPPDEEPVPPPP
jgi:MFS family permease